MTLPTRSVNQPNPAKRYRNQEYFVASRLKTVTAAEAILAYRDIADEARAANSEACAAHNASVAEPASTEK